MDVKTRFARRRVGRRAAPAARPYARPRYMYICPAESIGRHASVLLSCLEISESLLPHPLRFRRRGQRQIDDRTEGRRELVMALGMGGRSIDSALYRLGALATTFRSSEEILGGEELVVGCTLPEGPAGRWREEGRWVRGR